MLFNVLLQQLLDVYHTNSARLSHDLIFANKFRTYFTEHLTDFLHIKEKDLFYIPVGISAAITKGSPYPHIRRAGHVANKPSGIEIELTLESMEKKTILPSDAMSILIPATLLQEEWLTSLHDDLALNINPCYLKSQNKIHLIKALKLLSILPSYFLVQAHYWQARKCDAVRLFIDVIRNISMPILREIITLHQKNKITETNPKAIKLAQQFCALLEALTAPHLTQIRSREMDSFDIFARHFWNTYFVHFYPDHTQHIQTAKKALTALEGAVNFATPSLSIGTTTALSTTLSVCIAAFEILLDPESSPGYIKGPGYAKQLEQQNN